MTYLYYVYILLCSDKSYYVGITNDLDRRLSEHNSNQKMHAYTVTRRPVELVFYQEFNDVIQAIYFEKKLKGWTRAKKKALIHNNVNMLQILSECRNATHYKYSPKNSNLDE